MADRRCFPGPHEFGSSESSKRSSPGGVAPDGYGVSPSDLVQLLGDREYADLEMLGGVEWLARKLHTDLEHGLDEGEEQLRKRREAYGSNTYSKKVTKGFRSFVWDAFKNTTLIILMVCAVVSVATGMWIEGPKEGWSEGIIIGVAVLLVIFVTATSDYKQGLNFQNLNAEKENIELEVLRAGRRQMVSIFNLLVGDIVPLSIGGQVPADGVFVEGHSLSIDESIMTGESMPVKKDKSKPFLLSGCKVQDGQGTMLVTGVGLNTKLGQVMASISHGNGELTPLQVRPNGAATLISKVGLMVASVVLVIRSFAITFKTATARAAEVIKEAVQLFLVAVTIVVVALPGGSPLAVTLTSVYFMPTTMADQSLDRRLAASEATGSATTIRSDKTGTLASETMSSDSSSPEAIQSGSSLSDSTSIDPTAWLTSDTAKVAFITTALIGGVGAYFIRKKFFNSPFSVDDGLKRSPPLLGRRKIDEDAILSRIDEQT